MCPTDCADEGYSRSRTDYCQECEITPRKELFRNSTIEAWEKRLKEKAKDYDFDKVLSMVYEVMDFEEMPKEKLTVYSAKLLQIYLSERQYFDDVKDWKERNEK